jgi:hypothetical protein
MKDRSCATRSSSLGATPGGVKVLLVGLGRWGEKHLRVLGELGVDLWVADVSAERRAFAIQAGVTPSRAVEDFRRALPHVDAVDIVTPTESHLALASECLRAARDCFIEKPLTLTVAEGRRLAALVAETGRVLQVGHIFRFHPVTMALRERLAAAAAVRTAPAAAGFAPGMDGGRRRRHPLFDLFAICSAAHTAVTPRCAPSGRGLDDCSFTTVDYGDVPALSRPAIRRHGPRVHDRGRQELATDFAGCACSPTATWRRRPAGGGRARKFRPGPEPPATSSSGSDQ